MGEREMEESIDNPQASIPRLAKWIGVLANATFFYPLIVIGFLYGEWLLAWFVLGHPPIPALDDPQFIEGSSWLHNFTDSVLFGFPPVFVFGLALNFLHGMTASSTSTFQVLKRPIAFLVIWGSLIAILRWDPGDVVLWWFD